MEEKLYINGIDFYYILSNIDELNKTILLNLYASLVEFINLNNKEELVELLKKREYEFYVTNERGLTDKEIIDFELSRILEEYKKQIQKNIFCIDSDLTEKSDLELKKQLLVLVEHHLGQLKIFKEIPESMITKDDIIFIKKSIAYIESMLKIENGLYYETYLKLCEELERFRNNNLNKRSKG